MNKAAPFCLKLDLWIANDSGDEITADEAIEHATPHAYVHFKEGDEIVDVSAQRKRPHIYRVRFLIVTQDVILQKVNEEMQRIFERQTGRKMRIGDEVDEAKMKELFGTQWGGKPISPTWEGSEPCDLEADLSNVARQQKKAERRDNV